MHIDSTQLATKKLRLIRSGVLNDSGCYIHNKQNAPNIT